MQSMHDVGRTVLVVSHQMNMITAICERGIVLNQGTIEFDGSVEDAVLHYLPSGKRNPSEFDAISAGLRIGNDRALLHKAWVESKSGIPQNTFDIGKPIVIKMKFEILRDDIPWPYANYHVFDDKGNYVFATAGKEYPQGGDLAQRGTFLAECEIPPNLMNTGIFEIGVAAVCMDHGTQVCFWERDAIKIQMVENLDETLTNARLGYAGAVPGPIRPQLEWRISKCSHTE